MATYQLGHTGQEIDTAVDWVKNSSSTTENKINQHTLQIAAVNEAIGNPEWFSENNTSITEQLGNHYNSLTAHNKVLNGVDGLNKWEIYDLTIPEFTNSEKAANTPCLRFWKAGLFVYVEWNGWQADNNSVFSGTGTGTFTTKLPKTLWPVWNVFLLNTYPSTQAMVRENLNFDQQGNIYGWGFTQATTNEGRSLWGTAMYLAQYSSGIWNENGQLIVP